MLKYLHPRIGVVLTLLLLCASSLPVHAKVVPTSASFPSYNPHRRETPVESSHQTQPQPQPHPQIYSTLPEALVGRNPAPSSDHTPSQSNPNYFNYQVDQVPQPQQDSFVSFQNSPQPFQHPQAHPQVQHQLQPHPQQAQDPFQFQQVQPHPQIQPQAQFPQGFSNPQDFNFQEFDPSANEISEESPGFFTSLMTSLLDGTGLGGLLNRAREMWGGFSETLGGSSTMSRVAMGVMALPLMLPMAALPIGLGALGLMALPILQLTLPGIRRSLGEGAGLLRSEQCIERLSCNLARRWQSDAIFERLERSENRWLSRVSKSVKVARSGGEGGCKVFSCSPVTRMQDLVRRHLLGEGVEGVVVGGGTGNEAKSKN